MTAADVVERAAQARLEPVIVDGGLWWVSRGTWLRAEAMDPVLAMLLERFAPLVAARLRKVDAPPCARCKRPAVTVEAIGGRLLCDRHATEPILRPVEPPADWLAQRTAMPSAIVPEDPRESRRRVAMGDLEATRMPMPQDMARAITQRERRAGRGW
jgi:hypothetical protein